MMLTREFRPGDLVWFDPGVGYVLPGEVAEFHRAAQVITVQAVINNVTKTFTLNNLSSVKTRQDLGSNGVEDMVTISDLNEASILWNLRIRYDNQNIYTYIGSILVVVNPYRMFNSIYGLDAVAKYEGRILGNLPPHIFAMGAAAYNRLVTKNGENQVILISGESGAGKTETTKLLTQYLSAVNKSVSNLVTEQILEASPILESFGNAKTIRNDNSSRFGKYLEILFKDGLITGANATEYLLEKSRIVTQAPEERNFHVFYEILAGMPKEQKEVYGLMSAEKYFYLNQGGSYSIDGKNDQEDFLSLQSSMQVLGFTDGEQETIFKLLAAILHIGNVYFHRKQLKHGQEGVEVGSDLEIKWAAHLLQLNIQGIKNALTMKQTEIVMRSKENVVNPLNIDQALDARDAIAKSLYTSLFTWLVNRINKIMLGKSAAIKKAHKKTIFSVISVLDMFGFEEFSENSFEQLCINFANETLQHYFNKNIFKLEQAEYAKEKLEWTPIQYNDNQSIIHMISKKPIGVFHLLDDESNFPKASDLSFLEKCHYNHALNELYSRPRMSSMDFGIKHYAGQVWYNVEGFLDKNRDTVRYDVMGLLISSKDKMISKMFLDLRNFHEASKTLGRMGYGPNHGNGQFITMKPRSPTVAARFGDSLSQLFSTISQSHPFFIRCIKPNSDKCPMKFDMPVVLEQLRYTGLLETIRIRKLGYPIRYKYNRFVQKYRCLLGARVPRGAPTKEVARVILDRYVGTYHQDNYALGASKVFLRESMEGALETERQDIQEVEVVKLQQHVRGYLARKRYLAVKESTIKIQSAFRGHQVRQKYTQMRRGVVALQSIYRMRRQQSIYGEMKVEMIRRKELEKEARLEMAASKGRAGERNREKNRHTFEINRLSRSSLSEERRISTATSGAESSDAADDLGGKTRGSKAKKQVITHRAVTNVNHLDIPAQLAFILSKLDTWKPVVHMEKSLAKVSGQVPGMQRKEKLKLPHDIDYYVFSKVASVYFKSHLWQMKREPIQTPFLSKSKESDYNDSLAIFKLILRFMNDDALESGKREKVLGDYIVNQGISNQKLRDEILCQLANQTWKNDNIENAERGWLLMANCLSAFGPSKTLHKYLLKYVSDHAPTDGFRAICQQKLLRSAIQLPDSGKTRAFPPTILEWRANKKRVNMALPATCTDDPKHQLYAAVDSFSTAEEFAANILADRNVAELQGWTVSVEEGDTMVELSGGDFILDGLGEIELPPAFPVANKTSFLVTTDRSRGQLPLIVDTEMLLSGHHPVFSPEGRESQMGSVLRRNLRAQSHDRILAGSSRGRAIHNEELGLSSRSALNDRYFEDSRSAARSKSLDNLVDGQGNFFGLSESKLNKRYLNGGTNGGGAFMSHEEADMNENLDSISQRGGTRGRGEKWRSSRDETLGLSNKTPLNDRYFSQPDLIGGELEEGPTGQDRSRSSGNLVRGTKLDPELLDPDLAHFEYPEGDLSGQGRGQRRLHGNPRYVKGQRGMRGPGARGFDGVKSSAMSDTSEAPSIASHVRGVAIPSHGSDVDQFLDDLFMPVLDGNIDDGLSDARSLAASMKGGGATSKSDSEEEDKEVMDCLSRQTSTRRQSVLSSVKDIENTNAADDDIFLNISNCSSNLSGLCQATTLLSSVKGGKSEDGSEDDDVDGLEGKKANKKMSTASVASNEMAVNAGTMMNMGFQPIPGMLSPTPMMGGMMSPPPMLMPTPIQGGMQLAGGQVGGSNPHSLTSPIMMQPGNMMQRPGSAPGQEMQPAMAFTYVPVPVYNMGGLSLPGMGMPQQTIPASMPVGAQGTGASASRTKTPTRSASRGDLEIGGDMPSLSPTNKPQGTSTPSGGMASAEDQQAAASQKQSVDQTMAYQQAFLQNAVAQNMQIQQQLMVQNQALTQLLTHSNTSGPTSSMTTMMGTPMPSMMPQQHVVAGTANSSMGLTSAASLVMASQQNEPGSQKMMYSMGGAGQQMYMHPRRASADNLVADSSAGANVYSTLEGDAEAISAEMKQRSLSTPATPKQSELSLPPDAPLMMVPSHLLDQYKRDSTVRIGKWRWPPPKEFLAQQGLDGVSAEDAATEGFLEFKMRKLQERKRTQDSGDPRDPKSGSPGKKKKDNHASGDGDGNDSFDTSGEIQGIEWGEDDDDDFELEENKDVKMSEKGGKENIGKLKLTSEMKEKLEAVTAGDDSRKNSVRSNVSSDHGEPRKRSEINLKVGGKLKKWDTVGEVHRTIDIPEAPKVGTSGKIKIDKSGIPLPPPPPPAHLLKQLHVGTRNEKDARAGGSPVSSFYSPDGSLPDPHQQPPPVIKPLQQDDDDEHVFGIERGRRGSVSTNHTEASEKYELEESSEFLQPVDSGAPVIVDEDDYAALEDIKTKLYPGPPSNTHYTYDRVPWTLKIRKEIFSPSETLNSPLAINLIFCQIVTDVFSPLCIRFSNEDRSRMKTLLDEYSIGLKNVFSNSHKLSTKKNIIEMAKDFATYFSRLYPVSSSQSTDIQYLSVAHSGVRLVRREKSLPTDYLRVLETYQYEDIGEVSTMSNSGLQMVMHTGNRVVLSANKAGQIRNLLNQYIVESNSGTYDYVKALAAFSSRDDGALSFKKGEVIAVVPKHDAYTEKGWLYGIKDGRYGLFPSDFVERMSPTAVRREMKMISKAGHNGAHGRNSTSPADERFDRSKVQRNSAGDESEDGDEERRIHSHRNGHSKGVASDSDIEGERVPPIGLHTSDPDNLSEVSASAANVTDDGKHPLLEFALRYFRDVQLLMEGASSSEGGGQVGKKGKKNKKDKKGGAVPDGNTEGDWRWKNQLDMVKWTDRMINNSLLGLEPVNVNKMALECFACVMRYMGDMPLLKNQHEVDCVNTIFLYCRQFEPIRDEVYCQIMKQTTNNKSMNPDSCQRGWRLFSIIAAQFTSSELLKPYLFKYLETSAYDKRRAYHGTALVCLHNLRKTFKYGGRRNVPSIEEISAITAGRNSKRQIYRLPGGTERVINTKSTTVVEDVISELCKVIGIDSENEQEEFSLYCIVEGETFNVPLTKDHYILDVTTELQRDGAIYYLIFCRSIWHYPLHMDNTLYTEVVFNQIAPDYLEGLLLIMPGEQIDQNFVYDTAKIAALLHRAADMDHKPTIKETRFLLPKPALSARDIKPPQWVNMVQSSWDEGVSKLSTTQAKQKVLETLSGWPLFGSSFFAVRRVGEAKDNIGFEHIMALNKNGVSFLDQVTHETLIHYPFTEVISTRKVQTEDGTLFLDMKCGNLMQQRITRIQTDQANEIARLIRQYITIDQRMRGGENGEKQNGDEGGDDDEIHLEHTGEQKVVSNRNSEEKSHSPAR